MISAFNHTRPSGSATLVTIHATVGRHAHGQVDGHTSGSAEDQAEKDAIV
jgi:hypothetical protein